MTAFTAIFRCGRTTVPLEAEPFPEIDPAHPFIGNDLVRGALHQDMPFMQYVGTIDNI